MRPYAAAFEGFLGSPVLSFGLVALGDWLVTSHDAASLPGGALLATLPLGASLIVAGIVTYRRAGWWLLAQVCVALSLVLSLGAGLLNFPR